MHLHITRVGCEYNDSRVRKLAPNCNYALDAAHFRHLQVHKRDIRSVLFELRNRFLSVGRLGYQLHVGFGADQYADSLAQQSMVINRQDSNFPYITRHETSLFAEESEYAGFGGLCVSDRCRYGHLNLRARPHLAPKIQLSARQLCAFADSRQAPMSGPRAFVEYPWVNSDSVIAEPD